MHHHLIEDAGGDVVDAVDLCSDFCHRQWCRDNGAVYGGWNGAHEAEFDTVCASCGDAIKGVTAS